MKRARANLSIYLQTKLYRIHSSRTLIAFAPVPRLLVSTSSYPLRRQNSIRSSLPHSSLSINWWSVKAALRSLSFRVYTITLLKMDCGLKFLRNIYPTIGSLRSFCFALVFDGSESLLCAAAAFFSFSPGLLALFSWLALYTLSRDKECEMRKRWGGWRSLLDCLVLSRESYRVAREREKKRGKRLKPNRVKITKTDPDPSEFIYTTEVSILILSIVLLFACCVSSRALE